MKRGIGIHIVFFLMPIIGAGACIVAPPYPPQEQDVEAGGMGGMGQGGSDSISSSSSSTDMPAPNDKCGDGIRGPTEMCDDGNTSFGDACTSDCNCGYAPLVPPMGTIAFIGTGGACYIWFQQKASWPFAEYICTTNAMHLATIADVNEQAFVNSIVNPKQKSPDWTSTWIGGQRKNPGSGETNWIWVSGEPWGNQWWPWNTGEPNDGGSQNNPPEDCVELFGGFNDLACYRSRYFLCEG